MRLFALALLLATPLAAQDMPREVSVELVLLADGSQSIDPAERALQREGYAEAITHPEVIAAIEGSMTGSIAVVYVEWAINQVVVADWTVVDGPDSAAAFAAAIRGGPVATYGGNAIGAALLEGRRLLDGNGISGLRRVIDFSGDSLANMSGPAIAPAREEVLAAGITINGLPIVLTEIPRLPDTRLAEGFTQQIIGGPGAFVVTAYSRGVLAEAIRRKLVLEIAGLHPDAGRIASLR